MNGKQQTLQKRLRLRNNLVWIAAVLLSLGFLFAGIVCGKGLDEGRRAALWPWVDAALALPFLLVGLDHLLLALTRRRFKAMKVEEGQQWLYAHREKAAETAEKQLRKLRGIRLGSDAIAVFLTLLSFAASFLLGMTGSMAFSGLWFFSVLGAALAAERLRFPEPKESFTEEDGYATEEEYPLLFDTARRAAAASGWQGKLHLALDGSNNAAVLELGGDLIVCLGVPLLAQQSREELYHVLLHELGHIVGKKDQKVLDYASWLRSDSRGSAVTVLSSLIFSWLDVLYEIQFSLYRYAASIDEETRADLAMVEHGDARTAASCLTKLKYASLYEWESSGTEHPVPETLEEKIHAMLSGEIEEQRRVIGERQELYRRLAMREILARNASHPTLLMRLKTLGLEEPVYLPLPEDPAYRAEIAKAADLAEKLLLKNNDPELYQKQRQSDLEIIARFEESGRVLRIEDYSDVIQAFKQLGRLRETVELCERAIQELPESAAFARYILGCYHLHHWDESGIEEIYAVIEENSNYIQEGLGQIGTFCCLTGNEKELERYRKRATELGQRQVDEFSRLEELTKEDKLSPETLPPELSAQLLCRLEELDEGQLDRVWLLHKEISPSLSTSAMVLSYTKDTPVEKQQETYHAMFVLLDNIPDWQFSLFEYDTVKAAHPERIPGSLFYTGKGKAESLEHNAP